MKRQSKKLTATLVVAGLALVAVPAIVVAGTTNATAVAVKVSASLGSNTVATFTGTTGPIKGVVATCTAATTGFTLETKAGGLGPFAINNPKFTGCKDNLGGTDTLTSNSTNGAWTATYVNAASASASNMLRIGIPKAGQTLKSSFAANCTVTVFPTAAGSVSGTYDNAGHLRITNATISYSASGVCPAGTGSGTATFTTGLKSGGTGTPGLLITPPIFGIH